jgi:hypothetical protein
MVVHQPVLMPHMMVPMRCRVMPMLCHVVRTADEGPASAVAKHLAVAEAAAPAFRLARRTRGAVMGVPSAATGVLRAGVGVGSSTTVNVRPPVCRARSRHRWKRRWRLGSGLRVRRRGRWNFGRGLLRRRERLVGRGLLRSQGRSEEPKCQSGANERGAVYDRLHDRHPRLHVFAVRIAAAEASSIGRSGEFSGVEARPVS